MALDVYGISLAIFIIYSVFLSLSPYLKNDIFLI